MTDQPWLNDPVAPSGNASASQPWLNDPAANQDTSFGGALQEGLHDAAGGLGSTLGLLSKDAGFQGGQDAGKWLQNAVPAPANYQSAGGDMVSKLKAGQILGALKDLPRAAVEGAPAVAGGLSAAALGAAALPEAALGVGGAALGAGVYGALSSFGNDANARAAAQGHAAPTAGDQFAAAPTAIAQGGLQAIGLGKVPGAGKALAAIPSLLKPAALGAADATGAGAANVVGQAGNTIGTKQGLTVDPAQAGAAALQALAARAGGKLATQTVGGVKDAAGNVVTGIGMNLARKDLPAMTDDQAASYNRINNAYDQQAPQNPGANPTARINAMWKQQTAQLKQVVQGATATNQIDPATAGALNTALAQAAVHKSALDTNLLNRLNDQSIDPRLAQTLKTGLTDLDNMSQMVNYKQASGPFAALGAKVAGIAAPIAAVATGHPIEGGLLALGVGGHGVAGQVGQIVGRQLDKVAGTNLPPSLLLRAQAAKQAGAAGYDTTQDATSPVTSAYDALNSQKGQEDAIIAKANAAVDRKNILAQATTDGRLKQPMSQDQLDRVSIGLPPSDPIPVNTPLDANNQPLQPGGPSAPRPAPAPQQPQGPLQAPQAAPASALPASPPAPGLNGWQNHMANVLWQNRVPHTPQTIPNAVQNAVQSGALHPDMASSMLSQPHMFMGDRNQDFQTVMAQAMRDHGMEPPPAQLPPVRDPIRWQASGQNYQALGSSLQNMAATQGDPDLAVAIARITAITSATGKMDIANQVLSQRSHDAIALARAKSLLPPELLKGK